MSDPVKETPLGIAGGLTRAFIGSALTPLMILASLAGTPVYAISYDHKVTEFVKLAGQERRLMGLDEFMRRSSAEWIDPHLGALRVPPEAP